MIPHDPRPTGIRVKRTGSSRTEWHTINKSDFDPKIHEVWTGDDMPAPAGALGIVVGPPPAPVVAVDPLADIKADSDWRNAKGRGISKLIRIATAVSGRTPANGEEAIKMIEDALAAEQSSANSDDLPPLPPAG